MSRELKSKQLICSEVSVNNPWSQSEEEKEGSCDGKDLQKKRRFKPGMKK